MKILVSFLFSFILSSNVYCQVIGKAFLNGQSDHSGIKVKFTPFSPTAKLDSTFTNSDGSYSIKLSGGVYQVLFTKSGYQDNFYQNGDKIAIAENGSLEDVYLDVGNSIFISGVVKGRWHKDNIYYINGDVEVKQNDSLIIDEGTIVRFVGNFAINVKGTINSIGTKESPILFTSSLPNPQKGDWVGFNISGPSAVFKYCVFEFCSRCINSSAKTLIINDNDLNSFTDYGILGTYSNSYVEIKNNKIHNFQETYLNRGICVQASPSSIIECNTIYHGGGYGIYIGDNLQILNNTIFDMKGDDRGFGIGICNDGSPTIKNNHIYNCNHGIHYWDQANPLVLNNTIYKCNSGIYFSENSKSKIINNLITYNSFGIYQRYNTAIPTEISYNLVWNNQYNNYKDVTIAGIGVIVTKNQKGDDIDSYYNLSQDPIFWLDIPPFYSNDSPCINAGNLLYSPNIGFDSSNICGNEPTEVYYPPNNNDELPINIHPNPFNSFTTITLPDNVYNATLSFFDVLGNKVKEISNIKTNNIILKRDNLQTGIYFYLLMDSGKIIGNGKIMVY
jgi:parallel beta-helix repeat protein